MLLRHPTNLNVMLLATLIASTTVGATIAQSQVKRPADLLPAKDCLVYFAYDGTERHAAGWRETVTSRVDSPFSFERSLRQFAEAQQINDRVTISALERLASHVAKYGGTFAHYYGFSDEYVEPDYPENSIYKDYVLALPNGADVSSELEVAIRLYARRYNDAQDSLGFVRRGNQTFFGVVELLNDPQTWDDDWRTGADPSDATLIMMWEQDDILFVTPDYYTADFLKEEFAKDSVERISETPAFQRENVLSRLHVGRSPYFSAWTKALDVKSKNRRKSDAPTFEDLLRQLGLNGPRSLHHEVSYRGETLQTSFLLEVEKQERGLFDYWRQEPITLADLPRLPSDVASFAFSQLDLQQLTALPKQFSERFEKAFGATSTTRMLSRSTARVEELTGVPLDQLVSGFGRVFGAYDDDSDGLLVPPTVFVASINDKDQAKVAANALIDAVADAFGRELQTTKAVEATYEQTQVNIAPGITLTLGISDQWAAAALSQNLVADFFSRQQQASAPAWTVSKDLVHRLPQLEQPFCSIHFADTEKTWARSKDLFPVLSGIVKQFAPGPAAEFELPTVERIPDGLLPNVSVTYASDQGLERVSSISAHALPSTVTADPRLLHVAAATAMVRPVIESQRDEARRQLSRLNLVQIGLALATQADVLDGFSAGSLRDDSKRNPKGLSWIIEIAPYLGIAPFDGGSNTRFDRDGRWSSQHNLGVMRTHDPHLLQRRTDEPKTDSKGNPLSHYAGCAGVGEDARLLPVTHPKAGAFGLHRKTRIEDFRDGTSQTLHVGEVNRKLGPWTAAGDATLREFTEAPYINGPDGFGGWHDGAYFLFADGSVRFLNKDIDPKVAESLMTINGGESEVEF